MVDIVFKGPGREHIIGPFENAVIEGDALFVAGSDSALAVRHDDADGIWWSLTTTAVIRNRYTSITIRSV